MQFTKKVLVLKQVANDLFSSREQLSGILRVEKENDFCTLRLTLLNTLRLNGKEFYLALYEKDGEFLYFPLENLSKPFYKNLETNINILDLACGIFYVENDIPLLLAFGSCGSYNFSLTNFRKKFLDKYLYIYKKRQKELAEKAETEVKMLDDNVNNYDDEVVATENYFLNDAEVAEKLKLIGGVDIDESISTENDDFAFLGEKKEEKNTESSFANQTSTSGESMPKYNKQNPYFDSVKKELEDIFSKFKKEEILERCIADSRWVKIYYAEEKYYVVGVVKEDGNVKYVCYGVPAIYSDFPPISLKGYCSFLPLSVIKPKGEGYWMMFQDAITGECVMID